MENLLGQLPRMTSQGVFSLPLSPDRPMATIATRDISVISALLTDRDWKGTDRVAVFGPDHLTPEDMAATITEVLGTQVTFEQADLEQLAAFVIDRGASGRHGTRLRRNVPGRRGRTGRRGLVASVSDTHDLSDVV